MAKGDRGRRPDGGAAADECELVRRVLAGDKESFRLIVLRYQGMLTELIYRYTGGQAAAEDLVQETFLRAYQALDRYDPRFRLSTWLARIALNATRDQGRRQKVRQDAPVHELAPRRAAPDPAETAASAEAQRSVVEALGALPDPQREVVVLSVYNGFTQRQIAETLELPLGTVKTRQRSAFQKLRRLVAPLHPGGAA